MIRSCIGLIFLIAIQLHAQKVNVIYLGLSDESIPSISGDYDSALRDRLTMLPSVSLADYRQTRIYGQKAGFTYYPTVSKSLVQKLMKTVGDSTIVIWTRAEKYDISVQRKNLLTTRIMGDLRIKMVVYSLSLEQYMYTGQIHAKYSLRKGPAFFRPVKTVTHVSVDDRQIINDNLIMEASKKSENVIAAVIRSWLEQGNPIEEPDPGVEGNQQPRIEDLFGIPSVEGENIVPSQNEATDNPIDEQNQNTQQQPLLEVPTP